MLREFLRIFVATISFLIGFSCKNTTDQGRQVFHYNQPEGITTLDPAFARAQPLIWITHQLYNTLVEIDQNLHIVPSLAKRWEISEDRLTYTFYLRDDVYFHDNAAFAGGSGRKMTAKDVEYSLSRIIDKSTASPGAWIFNRRVDSIQPFKAIDDTTFRLRLQFPFHPILGILSMQYCSIVAHEVVDRFGKDFRRNPCGTGPFYLRDWEEGQAMIILRNEKYFEKDSIGNKMPYLDAVKISFLDSKATEFLEFQQGRLDFINDIDATFKDEVLTKKGDLKKDWENRIVLHKHPYLNTEYLGILSDTTNDLVRNSPFRLKKLKQAMNYAFDRRKLMLYLRNSIGTAAESGFIPAGLPSFNDSIVKGYHFDPEKSRQLLTEAGFPEGKGLPGIKLLTIPAYADLASFVAKQLEEIGIIVQVEAVQRLTLLEQMAKSKVMFFRGSWIADYPDAENYLSVFYSKNPAPPNYTRYKNAMFDQLYEKALQELNDSIRNDIYRQMDQMVMNDAPVIPLWYDMVIHLVQKRVSGFYPNAQNLLELRRVSIKKE